MIRIQSVSNDKYNVDIYFIFDDNNNNNNMQVLIHVISH